jgi:hypothetical protein
MTCKVKRLELEQTDELHWESKVFNLVEERIGIRITTGN